MALDIVVGSGQAWAMPDRSRRLRDRDILGKAIADDAMSDELRHAPKAPPKNAAAVELGRRGGLKGGLARAAKLSPEERSESARRAAGVRWHGA